MNQRQDIRFNITDILYKEPYMKKIDEFVLKIIKIIRLAASILMLVVTAVTVAQVIARYLFNNPIIWSEEFCMVTLIWFGFFCISTEVYRGGHMSIDVIYRIFPPKLQYICDILRNVIITCFSAVMTYYTIKVALVVGRKMLPISQLPKVLIYIPVVACAVMMTIYGVLLTIQTITGYKRTEVGKI